MNLFSFSRIPPISFLCFPPWYRVSAGFGKSVILFSDHSCVSAENVARLLLQAKISLQPATSGFFFFSFILLTLFLKWVTSYIIYIYIYMVKALSICRPVRMSYNILRGNLYYIS